MATGDKPVEPDMGTETDPSHDQLFREIGAVRTQGFGNLLPEALPNLLSVASSIGAGQDEAGKIEDALSQAVRHLGGIGTSAIEALLGMRETRGESVEERRKRAAMLYDHKSYEVFRTRFEPSLLMFVATYLRVLADEHRLTERERQLALAERGLSSGFLDTLMDYRTDNFGLTKERPQSSELSPIYHLRRRKYLAYSVQRFSVSVQVEDSASRSRVKRLLKIPNRRYYLVGRGRASQMEGYYRPPNLFTRIYRALVTRTW